ncbi:hypothetical protein [Thermococcus sp. Bubb.Bath]|uniref:hypothetical protein n=1 Tax=Thermococcus sp. Bubb.Bath TaxID=1638242 RepID=UPI00143A6FCF|nr:hypothetical protein [Thermococcus sp. Bubb.Bath]NJF25571.1 hypothetical protein [Thermococcus sp. Bubb.Bath]
MRGIVSLVIVGLIIGLTISGAANMGLASAEPTTTQSSENAYTKFWEILNKEASLVFELNNTANTTIAQELIETSREGELNAANISSLIWNALEQLKASGVKLHYTAQELKEMAENITRNGLPENVIQELKNQGWSDEEISALQTYIAAHANDTMQDFDMGFFLGNFSTAMARVGFKYAGYEAWALQREYWEDTKTPDTSNYDSNQIINPDLTLDWHSLHDAYNANDYGKMYDEVLSLTSDIQSVIENTNHAPNGAVFKDSYYWPGALKAYNLTRQIYVLLQSIKLGNGNPELKWSLNEKVMELQNALMVEPKKQQSSGSLPRPPRPVGPMPVRYPLDPPVSIQSDYGMISVKNVNVIVDSIEKGKVSYHVQLSLSAEGNVVSNVRITVHDVNGDAEGKISEVDPTAGVVTWNSPEFSAQVGFDDLKITGTVSVVYTSSDGPTPLSSPGDVRLQSTGGIDAESGPRTFEVMKEYSKTITATGLADPGKVSLSIKPSVNPVKAGDSAYFYVTLSNKNPVEVSGSYTLWVTVPEGAGSVGQVRFNGSVTLQANSVRTFKVGPVPYGSPGEYGYYGVFNFRDDTWWGFGSSGSGEEYNRKWDKGDIVVSANIESSQEGSLELINVIPSSPSETSYYNFELLRKFKEGENVTFNVAVKNSYPSAQDIELKLYIDGSLVSSINSSMRGNSTKIFPLHWIAQSGIHSYEVKLYRVFGGQEFLESSGKGSITVASAQRFAASLETSPAMLSGGGTVLFTIHAANFEDTPILLRGFVVDEDGAIIKVIQGSEGAISANSEKNISFTYTLYGVGNHTFRLFLDDRDGIPNDEGEEHWSNASVEVKPVGDIIASMDCDPTVVPLGGSTTCTVHVELNTPTTVTLNLTEVDFGGKRVWPNGPSKNTVRVNKQVITLSSSVQNNLTITITINDKLANYYFGNPIHGNYVDKFAGHSYLIKAIFDGLRYPLSDTITIVNIDSRSTVEKGIDYGSTALEISGEILSAIQLIIEGSNPIGWIAFGISIAIPAIEKGVPELQFAFGLGVNGFPSESDGNNVIGG